MVPEGTRALHQISNRGGRPAGLERITVALIEAVARGCRSGGAQRGVAPPDRDRDAAVGLVEAVVLGKSERQCSRVTPTIGSVKEALKGPGRRHRTTRGRVPQGLATRDLQPLLALTPALAPPLSPRCGSRSPPAAIPAGSVVAYDHSIPWHRSDRPDHGQPRVTAETTGLLLGPAGGELGSHVRLAQRDEPAPNVVGAVPGDLGERGERQGAEPPTVRPPLGVVDERSADSPVARSRIDRDLLDMGVAVDQVCDQVGHRPVVGVGGHPGPPGPPELLEHLDRRRLVFRDLVHTDRGEEPTGGHLDAPEPVQLIGPGVADGEADWVAGGVASLGHDRFSIRRSRPRQRRPARPGRAPAGSVARWGPAALATRAPRCLRQREEPAVGDPDQTGPDGDSGATATGDDDLFQSREDGQLHFIKETAARTFPVTAPTDATPLEEHEPEGTVPPSPLWAMKERRHEQWPHLFGHPDRIRARVGTGDATVYVIDDGKRHCMIGRQVGATTDGCVYSLVGRITKETYDELSSGSIDSRQAFLTATDVGLSGTADAPGVSNIFDVDFYRTADEIPVGVPPGRGLHPVH